MTVGVAGGLCSSSGCSCSCSWMQLQGCELLLRLCVWELGAAGMGMRCLLLVVWMLGVAVLVGVFQTAGC